MKSILKIKTALVACLMSCHMHAPYEVTAYIGHAPNTQSPRIAFESKEEFLGALANPKALYERFFCRDLARNGNPRFYLNNEEITINTSMADLPDGRLDTQVKFRYAVYLRECEPNPQYVDFELKVPRGTHLTEHVTKAKGINKILHELQPCQSEMYAAAAQEMFPGRDFQIYKCCKVETEVDVTVFGKGEEGRLNDTKDYEVTRIIRQRSEVYDEASCFLKYNGENRKTSPTSLHFLADGNSLVAVMYAAPNRLTNVYFINLVPLCIQMPQNAFQLTDNLFGKVVDILKPCPREYFSLFKKFTDDQELAKYCARINLSNNPVMMRMIHGGPQEACNGPIVRFVDTLRELYNALDIFAFENPAPARVKVTFHQSPYNHGLRLTHDDDRYTLHIDNEYLDRDSDETHDGWVEAVNYALETIFPHCSESATHAMKMNKGFIDRAMA